MPRHRTGFINLKTLFIRGTLRGTHGSSVLALAFGNYRTLGRLLRWRLRLSEFDFEIKYNKGKLNNQADALSRLRTLGETEVDIDEDVPCYVIEDTDVQNDDVNIIYDMPNKADELLIATNPIEETELVPVTTEELLRSQFFRPLLYAQGGQNAPCAVAYRHPMCHRYATWPVA